MKPQRSNNSKDYNNEKLSKSRHTVPVAVTDRKNTISAERKQLLQKMMLRKASVAKDRIIIYMNDKRD